MPSDVKRRARVAQVFSVLDSYGWQPMVITVFVQRVVMPMRGGKPDQGAIDAALPQAGRVLAAVEGLMDGGEFLIGGALSLADLHLVPILDYFARTKDGHAALARHPRLSAWWGRIERRPSVVKT